MLKKNHGHVANIFVSLHFVQDSIIMKKTLFILLAINIMWAVSAQTSKCGIDTKALVAEEIASGAESIRFLAKMAPGFDRGMFEKAGIVFGAQAGDIYTLRVPVASLPMLDESKQVLLYSISHRIAQPENDLARQDTRTDSVYQGLGVIDGTPYTGEGVYIGVTDWGFDYTNLSYNNRGDTNRRVERAWDHFRRKGPAPAGFDYGTEIIGYNALMSAKGDTSNLYNYGTHGTHVTGIAAGNGIRGEYRGHAPKAKILLCSFGLGEAEWMDGVQWMRGVARDSARRLVVNSSWGMYSFSCIDGSSLLSQAIDNWSAEGTVFCTSAGNNGDNMFHTSRNFATTPDTLRTVAEYYNCDNCIGQALIIWGEPGHDFSAGFRMQAGTTVWASPMYSTADGDQIVYDTLRCGDIAIPYRALIEHINPFDHRPHIQLDVDKNSALELQLYIAATSGTVHAWNVANKENHAGNEGANFKIGNHQGFWGGDPNHGIGEPACAAKAISIAAHRSGVWNSDTTAIFGGDIASFSSYGPLITGVQKPEVSAPGVNVISSISPWCDDIEAYARAAQNNSLPIITVQGNKYVWASMSGTSMSSPAATGVVALVLQANPLINTDQVRDIIMSTARNDSKTGPLHAADSASVRWGWGKVDALAAVNKAVQTVGIEQTEEMRMPIFIYPNPTTETVTIMSGHGEPQQMEVFSIDGRTMTRQTVTERAAIDVSRWPHGVYIIRMGSRTAKLLVQ